MATAIQSYAPGIGLTGDLHVEILRDGITARLLAPFRVRSRGMLIEAPKGMDTDFASVPRFFWRWLPPWGRYSPAVVIHDWLYKSGKVSRAEADLILLDLMERLGVSWIKRQAIYRGVRLGGWVAWRKYRKAEKPAE